MKNLSTDRLKLRPWQRSDEESLAKYANNRKISINLRDAFPYPYTLADARSWIELASVIVPPTSFAIEVDSQAVGGIGFKLGEDVFRKTGELGYWLGEPYWGQGLVTEAVRLVTDYGFQTFDLVRIYAGVFDWNPASARVLEKAGYVFESRMKKSVIKDGKILDQLMYVMIR